MHFVICESDFILGSSDTSSCIFSLCVIFPHGLELLCSPVLKETCFILLLKYFLMFLAQITNLGFLQDEALYKFVRYCFKASQCPMLCVPR